MLSTDARLTKPNSCRSSPENEAQCLDNRTTFTTRSNGLIFSTPFNLLVNI